MLGSATVCPGSGDARPARRQDMVVTPGRASVTLTRIQKFFAAVAGVSIELRVLLWSLAR